MADFINRVSSQTRRPSLSERLHSITIDHDGFNIHIVQGDTAIDAPQKYHIDIEFYDVAKK